MISPSKLTSSTSSEMLFEDFYGMNSVLWTISLAYEPFKAERGVKIWFRQETNDRSLSMGLRLMGVI